MKNKRKNHILTYGYPIFGLMIIISFFTIATDIGFLLGMGVISMLSIAYEISRLSDFKQLYENLIKLKADFIELNRIFELYKKTKDIQKDSPDIRKAYSTGFKTTPGVEEKTIWIVYSETRDQDGTEEVVLVCSNEETAIKKENKINDRRTRREEFEIIKE